MPAPSTPATEDPAGDRWWSETESPKAWMSVRDADLYEALLHRLAVRADGRPLRILEWGSGRSTLWYTAFLDRLGAPYTWLTLEYDRTFFERDVEPELRRRGATVLRSEALDVNAAASVESGDAGIAAVVFDAGELRPFLPAREADRAASLDDYVELPARLGVTFDLAVVDGRKRRRCVRQAAELVGDEGLVILHDAWRRHYQCAWDALASGRRFGDEWWIGAQADTTFEDVLPWHAFERYAEPLDT